MEFQLGLVAPVLIMGVKARSITAPLVAPAPAQPDESDDIQGSSVLRHTESGVLPLLAKAAHRRASCTAWAQNSGVGFPAPCGSQRSSSATSAGVMSASATPHPETASVVSLQVRESIGSKAHQFLQKWQVCGVHGQARRVFVPPKLPEPLGTVQEAMVEVKGWNAPA